LLEAFVEAHEELFGEPIAGKEGYLATLAKATQLMASWGSVRTHPT
jgi:hypothetical protein